MIKFKFIPRFTPKIIDGTKPQSFRRTKKCNVGDMVRLCEQDGDFIRDVECTVVIYGRIDLQSVCLWANDKQLDPDQVFSGDTLDNFAKADGFDNHNQLLQFFGAQGIKFPFCGWLHKWAP